MSVDDELRRRMQEAADRAGEGIDPTTVARAATSRARAGTMKRRILFGGIGVAGLVAGGVLGFTVLAPDDEGSAPAPDATVIDASERTTTLPTQPVVSEGSNPSTDTTVGPVTSTTTPAANVPPVIAQAAAAPNVIQGPGSGCSNNTSTVSVVVTDASGVASVRVEWSLSSEVPVGSTQSGAVDLTRSGTTWSGTITVGENPDGADTAMTLQFVATDAQGLTSALSANNVLLVEYCLA